VRLLRRFLRFMRLRDVAYLIVKPFLGAQRGPTKAEMLSRAVEHGALKDAAAELTRIADRLLERVASESLAERRKLREQVGSSRG
jgi:anaerobic magnesium-protoporphyrin IX monomethyl ester cyclase